MSAITFFYTVVGVGTTVYDTESLRTDRGISMVDHPDNGIYGI